MEKPEKQAIGGAIGFIRDRRYLIFGAIVLAALIIRSPQYGNPDIHLDEEFYLLVGDRMLHGALPYVDIWDRKPIGLFLIFAFARLFGGEGFIQYQILASLAAGATACFIWLIARRATGPFGAGASAIAYLLWLLVYSGQGGQSPVFYNGMTAFAAWAAFKANESDDPRRLFRLGTRAMLVCGLILQIKYTAIPEGAFFGLWFLWRMRQSGSSVACLIKTSLWFALLGIAPTALATVFYAMKGHLHEFAFANFESIFLRGRLTPQFLLRCETFILLTSFPLLLYIPFGIATWWHVPGRLSKHLDFQLVCGWLVAALLGFAMVGNFYDHYFLPVLVPLLIGIAPLLTATWRGMLFSALLMIWPAGLAHFPAFNYNHDERTAIMQLTTLSKPYLKGRCMFIYDGPSSLYMTTNSCLTSNLVYPDHFSNAVESNAMGIDVLSETKRVISTHPGVIVTSSMFVIPQVNNATLVIVRAAIKRDYVLVRGVRSPDRNFYVWAWRGHDAGTATAANASSALH